MSARRRAARWNPPIRLAVLILDLSECRTRPSLPPKPGAPQVTPVIRARRLSANLHGEARNQQVLAVRRLAEEIVAARFREGKCRRQLRPERGRSLIAMRRVSVAVGRIGRPF